MRSEHIYYLFIALYEFGLGATITLYVPLLAAIGCTYSELAVLNLVFQGAMFLAEIPTGWLADRHGRASSVVCGAALLALGGFCYAVVWDFWTVLVTELLCAFGFACISGALTAWMVDARDRTTATHLVLGRGMSIRSASLLGGNIVAVYLAPSYGEQVGFVIMGVLVSIAMGLAFISMRPRDVTHGVEKKQTLRLALAKVRATPSLAWALVLTAVMGSTVNLNLYWVLFMRTRLSLPEAGWMASLLLVAFGAAGWLARGRLGNGLRSGGGHVLSLAIAGVTIACFTLGQPTYVWAALIVMHELGRGMFQLFNETFIHERVEQEYRATFGSLASVVAAVGCALTLLVTIVVFRGDDPDPSSIPTLWLGTGIFCLASVAVLWHFRPR